MEIQAGRRPAGDALKERNKNKNETKVKRGGRTETGNKTGKRYGSNFRNLPRGQLVGAQHVRVGVTRRGGGHRRM